MNVVFDKIFLDKIFFSCRAWCVQNKFISLFLSSCSVLRLACLASLPFPRGVFIPNEDASLFRPPRHASLLVCSRHLVRPRLYICIYEVLSEALYSCKVKLKSLVDAVFEA